MMVNPAKMAELTEMPFGVWTQVGQSTMIDGVHIPVGRGHLERRSSP